MQQYAEDAVTEHLSKTLQPAFFRGEEGVKCAPYTTNRVELPSSQLSGPDKPRHQAKRAFPADEARRALRGREIMKAFDMPTEMKIFSYSGPVDTVMTRATAYCT